MTTTTAQALAGTFCNKTQECTSDVFVQVIYGSSDTCRARFLQQFQLDAKATGYGVSESGGAACNAALGSASCQDVLNGIVPDACKFTGTLGDGSSCTADAQCATGSCFIDETATCGKCGPRAVLGADCTNANCERGLKCGSSKTCTNGQAGAACGKDADCRALTYCRSGVCTNPLGDGAACAVAPTSADVPCDVTKALFCFPAQAGAKEGTCKKVPVTFAEIGAKCGLNRDPISVDACTNSDCASDKCVARVADGTACAADGKCQQPASCRNGICSLRDPNLCK